MTNHYISWYILYIHVSSWYASYYYYMHAGLSKIWVFKGTTRLSTFRGNYQDLCSFIQKLNIPTVCCLYKYASYGYPTIWHSVELI